MKGLVKWVDNVMFVAKSGTGHSIVLVTILKKARQEILSCEAEVEAKRVASIPSVFESIHLKFKVAGVGLNKKQVQRAVELSAEKYCSASIMLKNSGVKVTHDFEIINQ